MNKNLRPAAAAAAAAAYEPVQKHKVTPGIPGWLNYQPHDCLLNRRFRRRSKKTSKLRVTGLCAGNSPGPVNSPHKWPVTWKIFSFDDVIMNWRRQQIQWEKLYGKHYTNHINRVLCCSTRITLSFVPDFVSLYGFKCVYFISIEPQARKRGNIQKNGTSKSASTNCEHTYNNNDILNSHTICTQLCVHTISHVCNVGVDPW